MLFGISRFDTSGSCKIHLFGNQIQHESWKIYVQKNGERNM